MQPLPKLGPFQGKRVQQAALLQRWQWGCLSTLIRARAVREVVDSTTYHTSTRMTGRMEVVGRILGRRRWSDAEKLEILGEAFRPSIGVCDVIARR